MPRNPSKRRDNERLYSPAVFSWATEFSSLKNEASIHTLLQSFSPGRSSGVTAVVNVSNDIVHAT
jgi:hypothetical protein